MESDSEETSRRPLLWILGGVIAVLVLAVIGVAAYFIFFQPDSQIATSDYVAQTACDHPFFPLRKGAVWHYSGDIMINDGSIPAEAIWTVQDVHGNLENATAIVVGQYQYGEATSQILETVAYRCTPQGITRDSLILMSGEQSVSQYSDQTGNYLLPPDQLIEGASWEYLYNVVTDFAPPGTDYAWAYEATDTETIDNDAGTFDAIRVEGARSEPAGQDASTEWFAFGVGQVHSERVQNEAGVDVVTTMTLTRYALPEGQTVEE